VKARTVATIAWTGLRRNPLRSFLMMIGVVVGITALTLVLSAGLGARQRVMERVEKFGVASLMVNAGGGMERGRAAGMVPVTTLKLADAEAIVREIGAIADAAPFARLSQVDSSWQGRTTSAPVFGVTPAWGSVWDWYPADGEFVTDDDMAATARVCAIGPTVVKELFGEANPIGETIQVGAAPFRVVGVMQPKGTSPAGGDMDHRIFIPLSTFMRRVANVDHLNGIKLRLRSVQDLDRTTASVTALLREQHRLGPDDPDDFAVTTPAEVTVMAEQVAGTFNLFLVLIAGISLLAGGVVVANIMLMSVTERRREIGLRKAVGAHRRDILQLFLLEAGAVTLAGGIVGLLLGLAGVRLLAWLTDVPAVVAWEVVAAGLVFSAAVGILAGLQPARRAAAMTPIDALRA
jgi:putative ABC transport system permease protein